MAYTVRLSHQITRRKYVHYIRDPSGRTVYAEGNAERLFRWLIDQEPGGFVLDLGNLRVHVTIATVEKS